MSQVIKLISNTGPGGFVETITGNDAIAAVPTAGNINVVGSGNITVLNTGVSTETITLVGTTNHAVQIGNASGSLTSIGVGTNGQVLIGATAADPAFATLTSSDSSIAFTTGANTLSLQVAGGTTTGKTITGNSGGALSPTAGNWNIVGTGNITTSGAGSTLTASLTGPASFTWSAIFVDQTAAVNNGYIINKITTLVLALPATAAAGDIIEVTGINAAAPVQFTQAAGQQIYFGTASTTLGATGTLTATAQRDSLRMVCVIPGASTVWNVISSIGNWTPA